MGSGTNGYCAKGCAACCHDLWGVSRQLTELRDGRQLVFARCTVTLAAERATARGLRRGLPILGV